jgi:methanogenic corrinoid protein MtbC1
VGACLPEERHEWGILSALTQVQESGWRIHYLGPDLPVNEMIDAAWTLKPKAIGLSSSSADGLETNLAALADLPARLPPGTTPIMGGSGADAHAHLLKTYGFRVGVDAFLRLGVGA